MASKTITRRGWGVYADGKLVGNYSSDEAAQSAYNDYTKSGNNIAGSSYDFGKTPTTKTTAATTVGQSAVQTSQPVKTQTRNLAGEQDALRALLESQAKGGAYSGSGLPADVANATPEQKQAIQEQINMRVYGTGTPNFSTTGTTAGQQNAVGGTGTAGTAETTPNRPILDLSGFSSTTGDGTAAGYYTTQPTAPMSEEDYRTQALQRAQAMIDATSALYNQDIQRLTKQGEEAMATTSSMAVSAGLAGSPFQAGMESRTQASNEQVLQARTAERSAEIASITAAAEDRSTAQYESAMQRYQQDRAFYTSERDAYQAQQKATQEANRKYGSDTILSLAQAGYSLSEMSSEDYQSLLSKSGLSDFEAKALWANNTPAANANYSVQNGMLVGTYFDPVTQKPIVTTTALPSSLTSTTGSAVAPKFQTIGGSTYWYDENNPSFDESGNLIMSPTSAGLTPEKEEALLGNLTKDERTYLNQVQDNARQQPEIKTFNDVRAAYEQGMSSAKQGTGMGDLVLLRTLAKITDPSSAVREEEFRTFAGAQGALMRYGIQLTKGMWSGERLTDDARKQFSQTLQDIYDQRSTAYTSAIDFYGKQLSDAGIDPSYVSFKYLAPTDETGGGTNSDPFSDIDWDSLDLSQF